MDDLLTRRYQALFRNYGVGGNELVVNAKGRLVARMERTPDLLRPDAAHFLVVTLDHMVIQACSAYLPDPDSPLGYPLSPSIEPSRIGELVERCLDIIFEDLAQHERRPASSHAVIRAIDRQWPNLGNLFNWS